MRSGRHRCRLSVEHRDVRWIDQGGVIQEAQAREIRTEIGSQERLAKPPTGVAIKLGRAEPQQGHVRPVDDGIGSRRDRVDTKPAADRCADQSDLRMAFGLVVEDEPTPIPDSQVTLDYAAGEVDETTRNAGHRDRAMDPDPARFEHADRDRISTNGEVVMHDRSRQVDSPADVDEVDRAAETGVGRIQHIAGVLVGVVPDRIGNADRAIKGCALEIDRAGHTDR